MRRERQTGGGEEERGGYAYDGTQTWFVLRRAATVAKLRTRRSSFVFLFLCVPSRLSLSVMAVPAPRTPTVPQEALRIKGSGTGQSGGGQMLMHAPTLNHTML